MREQQLDSFLDQCAKALAGVPIALSVVLTGSFARRNYAVGPDGEIRSTPDIIPVLGDAEPIGPARDHLFAFLRPVGDNFGTAIHANLTRRSAFVRAAASRYAETAADERAWLRDDLEVRGTRAPAGAAPGWDWQPVSYYLAKYRVTGDARSLEKALGYAERANMPPTDRTPEALAALLRTLPAVDCLVSTKRLLTGLDGAEDAEATFTAVRDAVFLENQGMSYSESHLTVTPHE